MDGLPVKICIPSKKGKVLVAGTDGALTCENPSKEAKDDQWYFLKVFNKGDPAAALNTETGDIYPNDGYNIVSANFRQVMDYDPSTGEQISVVPYNEIDRTHTIWHTTEDNEIYTFDREGNRKYLWSVLGNIYVTPDEHLAETWKAISMGPIDADAPLNNFSDSNDQKKWIILLSVLILALLVYLFYSRRR